MSYPPTNDAGYDLSLLYPVSDPVVGNPHSRDPISAVAPLSSAPPQPQLYTTGVEKVPDSSTVGYSPGVVSYAHKGESKGYEPVVAVVPWYRTRRGITIIVAITIVIIGAVVGGVVGRTHHSSSSKPQSNTSGQQGTGSATRQGQQGTDSAMLQSQQGTGSATLQGQQSTGGATLTTLQGQQSNGVGHGADPTPTSSSSNAGPTTTTTTTSSTNPSSTPQATR